MQALKAQGETDEAALAEKRFAKAWKEADFRLSPAARSGT